MLLEWINNLGLLSYDAESNVLLTFPPSVRKTIITEVVSFLHQAMQNGPGLVTNTVSSSAASTPTVLMNALAQGAAAAGAPYAISSVTPTAEGELGALTTVFHVRWVLEVVGQAFNLPLEDINIVSQAATIYIQWLMEPEKRPDAIIKADLSIQQHFLQTILRQISLLFQVKRVDGVGAAKPLLATLASKHVEICKLMLKALCQVANPGSSNLKTSEKGLTYMNEETWHVMLKVILGITDYLLRMPSQPYSYLAEELGETLISVFMEIWLRSQTFAKDLWKSLKTCYPGWTHRLIAISHWSAVSLALTQRLTRILYGQGTTAVAYTVQSDFISLELEDRFVVFSWYQILQLLGSPLKMTPSLFFRSVLGMEKVIQVFHSIGMPPRLSEGMAPGFSPPIERHFPDGNTLLRLFGPWLFEATSRSSSDCSEGRAQAFGVLCRIFARPQHRTPFLPIYLHQFYATIIDGLKGDLLSLVFIIVNCEDIFSLGLPGARVLCAPLVVALQRIIPNLERPLRVSLNLDDLRRAAYKLLCTMYSACLHFAAIPIASSLYPPNYHSLVGGVPVKEVETSSSPILGKLVRTLSSSQSSSSELTSYYVESARNIYRGSSFITPSSSGKVSDTTLKMAHLRGPIFELLLTSFCSETDSGNLRYLINAMTVFVMDEANTLPVLPSLLVELLEHYLVQANPTIDVCLVAVESLSKLAIYDKTIEKYRPGAIRSLVLALCGLFSSFVSRNQLAQHFRVTIALMECSLRWICGSNWGSGWLAYDPGCLVEFLKILKSVIIHSPIKRNESMELSFHASTTRASSPSPSISPSPSTILSITSTANRPLDLQLSTCAESVLARLVHYFGIQKFNQHFPVQMSSLGVEDSLLPNTDDDKGLLTVDQMLTKMRYFVLNGSRIVGYLERERKLNHTKNSTSLLAITRTLAGKFTWGAQLKYSSNEEKTIMPFDQIGEDILELTSIKLVSLDKLETFGTIPLADSNKLQKAFLKEHSEFRKTPVAIVEMASIFNESVGSERFASDEKRLQNYKCIEELALKQFEYTSKALVFSSRGFHHYKARPFPLVVPTDQLARLALTHSGLTALSCRDCVLRLPACPELLTDLKVLDELPERESIAISVVYIKSSRETIQDIFGSKELSADFQSFILSLGWPVNCQQHVGFLGEYKEMQKVSSPLAIPYFADGSVEVVFHLPHLLNDPTTKQSNAELNQRVEQTGIIKDEKSINMADSTLVSSPVATSYMHMMEDVVMILWIEDLDNMLTIPNKLQTRALVYICISPIVDANESAGLYRIRIMVTGPATASLAATTTMASTTAIPPLSPQSSPIANSSETVFLFGPLLDGMIIRRENLGRVVRETAISATLFCRYHIQNLPRPLDRRANLLQHIINKYASKNSSVGKYYNELLFNCGP